ncbi:PTS sugar transporter subunit IIA [Lactobacillus acetotolerans]|uniref:PTS sugar transporter subunit IIA n=1 Tax=Lactobacillus acetotolerans TaxID=1600 RepID=UPI0019D2A1A8|nr:PTS fructose transporter subunit IIA [Lactobacillus acetotolerans]MBN7276881.1 PTS fructose transporter subunit IIA [Lactobacillus acetotolerans]
MKYDICIIGHGNFPDGIKSAVNLIAGTCEKITCFNLNEQTTHEQFKKDINKYLDSHKNVIVFADMTGGAPYQIVAERILSQDDDNKYVIAGISLNLILDIYLKNMSGQLNTKNIDSSLKHVIKEARSLMQVISHKTIFEKV